MRTLGSKSPTENTRNRDCSISAEIVHDVDLVRDLLVHKGRSSVSWLWKSDNGIRSAIAELETEAEVEGTLEETDVFFGTASPTAGSNK